jgi:hypothetical protein
MFGAIGGEFQQFDQQRPLGGGVRIALRQQLGAAVDQRGFIAIRIDPRAMRRLKASWLIPRSLPG